MKIPRRQLRQVIRETVRESISYLLEDTGDTGETDSQSYQVSWIAAGSKKEYQIPTDSSTCLDREEAEEIADALRSGDGVSGEAGAQTDLLKSIYIRHTYM